MHTERKRFSYLTGQQRALNSGNVLNAGDHQKVLLSSRGGTQHTSAIKSQKNEPERTPQMYKSFSRNSSVKKASQPLNELSQNHIFSDYNPKPLYKNPLSSNNKQNIIQRASLKTNEKPSSSFSITSKPFVQESNHLHLKIKQLQEQNSMILKQTQEKFILMEKHLQKVQGILKDKQITIENLLNEKEQMKDRIKCLEADNEVLVDQKEQLKKIIYEKNEEIKKVNAEKQQMSQKEGELIEQLNTYALKSKLAALQASKVQKPEPQPLPQIIQTLSSQAQTQIESTHIDQLILKSKQSQINDKLNYRQKYEALFKRALEMEDQMYKLKEELFDSQNQVKTIQQEFNTFKIFNQIEKINQNIN